MDETAPILEFDPAREDVAARSEPRILPENRWEDGPRPLYEVVHSGRRLGFFHPGVGAPLAAGLLEEVIACGCTKFISCGGCGVLERDVPVGRLVVVTSAVRDEGVSYHYLPAAREVAADPEAAEALESTLRTQEVPYRRAKTWTADAPYRETRDKIAARKEEACLTVEMESAAMMAVARF
jgi:uridine phosphorylase